MAETENWPNLGSCTTRCGGWCVPPRPLRYLHPPAALATGPDVTADSLMTTSCSVPGPCCGSGQELGPHGLHLSGFSAVPHPGVLRGVEHGELGGDLACRHRRVSRRRGSRTADTWRLHNNLTHKVNRTTPADLSLHTSWSANSGSLVPSNAWFCLIPNPLLIWCWSE